MHRLLTDRTRRFDEVPIGVRVAPEGRPPGVVERIERPILGLEPFDEGGAAQLAVALAAVLVGNVPHGERGVIGVPLGQLSVDEGDLFAIDR